MKREDVEQMLLELTDEFTCRCGPEYEGRNMHHPDCKYYLHPNIGIIRALLAERDAALKEQDRLVRAWEAMHKNQVKQSKDHEDYFYKSQRRMTELVAERDAAFAAGQRLFDAAATAETLLAHSLMDGKIAPEMEDHFEAWLKELTGACSKEAGAALGIRALAIRDRPE